MYQHQQNNVQNTNNLKASPINQSDSNNNDQVQINRIEQNQKQQIKQQQDGKNDKSLMPQSQHQNQGGQGIEKKLINLGQGSYKPTPTSEAEFDKSINDQKGKVQINKVEQINLIKQKNISDAQVSFKDSNKQSEQSNIEKSESAQQKYQNLESEKTSGSTDYHSSDSQNDQKGKVQINRIEQNQKLNQKTIFVSIDPNKSSQQQNMDQTLQNLKQGDQHTPNDQETLIQQSKCQQHDDALIRQEVYNQYISIPLNSSGEQKSSGEQNSNPNQELQKFQQALCVQLQEMIKQAKQDPTKNIHYNKKELKYHLMLSDDLKKQEKELLEFFEGWISYTEINKDSQLRSSGSQDFETECLNSFISYVEVQKKKELNELKSLIQDESTLNNWKNIMDKLKINNIQFFVMLCTLKKNELENEFAKYYIKWWFEWNQTSVFTKEKYQ